MRMRRGAGLLPLLAAVVVALLAGCQAARSASDSAQPAAATSPDSADATTPPAAADPSPTSWCGLVSAAVVKSTLGMAVGEPRESFDATEIDCSYEPVNGGLTVVVRFRTGQDAGSFARGRHEADTGGEPTSDVIGVGDEAYLSSVEFGDTVTNTLVARKGSVQMLVAAPVSVDAEKTLVSAVFAALR